MHISLHRAAGTAVAFLTMGAIAFGQHYNQTNLVANTSGVAPTTDSALVNPWGMARGASSPWWVSDQHTGLSTLYNGAGSKLSLTVTIPAAVSGNTGSPTGVIYNGSSTDFLLPNGKAATFIFCTLDGMIVGWNSGGAMTMVKTTNQSSYTGLTIATVKGRRYLYAANFNTGHVDVYDNMFRPVPMGSDQDGQQMGQHLGQFFGRPFDDDGDTGGERFEDDRLPPNYVPFNVQAIGDNIVVTWALHIPGNLFETDGPGNGYVDIYSSTGRMLLRLQHGDWLNAPWGVALAPLDFGIFSHDLLVGQFAGGGTTQSSGYIAAYDMTTGLYLGLLEDTSGNPLAINGVWAISPGNPGAANGSSYDATGAPAAELYFTAGPGHGSGGLFGYLTPVSTELTEGNDQ